MWQLTARVSQIHFVWMFMLLTQCLLSSMIVMRVVCVCSPTCCRTWTSTLSCLGIVLSLVVACCLSSLLHLASAIGLDVDFNPTNFILSFLRTLVPTNAVQ